MKGYKGFEKGLICKGKQYAENTIFEEEKTEICQSGIHFCESPFDVWQYYPPYNYKGEPNEFCEVESLEEPITDDNRKFYTTKLKIKNRINLTDFVKVGVKFILEKTKDSSVTNTGSSSVATNSINTGYRSNSINTGNGSNSTNTGNGSNSTNTGDFSNSINTGNGSNSTNTGDFSTATVEGKNSIAVVTGYEGRAKGKKGCWLVCTERDINNNVLCVKAVKVDGENIKEDVFYMVKNGVFIECK